MASHHGGVTPQEEDGHAGRKTNLDLVGGREFEVFQYQSWRLVPSAGRSDRRPAAPSGAGTAL